MRERDTGRERETLLTVLVGVLDEYAQLLHAQLYGGTVIGHPTADADQHRDHRVDALVEQTHCRRAVRMGNGEHTDTDCGGLGAFVLALFDMHKFKSFFLFFFFFCGFSNEAAKTTTSTAQQQ